MNDPPSITLHQYETRAIEQCLSVFFPPLTTNYIRMRNVRYRRHANFNIIMSILTVKIPLERQSQITSSPLTTDL